VVAALLAMLSALLPATLAIAPASATTTGDLVITGVIDGPLSGGVPKAIELYVVNDIADLSIYGVASANNGAGPSAAPEFMFPADAALAGDFIYVATEATGFNSFFAFDPDYTSNAASINGDDAIELFKDGSVVDVFGEVSTDGTGQPWEYLDGWAYRVNETGQDGSTFQLAFWTFSGPDALDGETSNAAAASPFPIGTYVPGAGAPLLIDCGAALATDHGTAASTTISAIDGDSAIVDMRLVSDTVPPGGNVTAGALSLPGGVGTAASLGIDLDGLADFGAYSATIEAENAAGEVADCELSILITPLGVTAIHDVQGAGSASALVGIEVTVEGIVVGDFQDGTNGTFGDDMNGFHVQEEDGDADADPLTSEGIFVYDGSSPATDVTIGDKVTVTGFVSEFFGLTEITSFSGVSVLSGGNPLPTAASASLPVASIDEFEAFEGMRVTFSQPLVISEYFNFDRFGEIVLTSQRNLTPTAEVEPGPSAQAEAAEYLLDRITLDDGRTNQNPDPAIHPNGGDFDLDNLFRGGDTVQNVTGVMDYAFGLYRIQPTQGADYTNANPRPTAPDAVGGELTAATFNVLNYFTTLDDSGPICGPAGDQGCRDADNAEEFTRQRDKIIAAMATIDADIFGLMEIENHPGDVPTADLVDGLNTATAPGTYDFVATGAIGEDAIRQAIIYKPATVTPIGAFETLDSDDDPTFDDSLNRPMVVQTFMENASGAMFTAAVNHLKSKGSPCDAVGDPDTGDGSGNCNLTRTAAATAIVNYLATDPTGSGDADFLVMGDLNSYDKEGPIDVLIAGGFRDLVFDYEGEGAYSYVFDGQIGYLDYQMANAALSSQATGATVWHINADEPDLIDYDTSFKGPNQDAIYWPDAYRSSDHDPVIVGLDLTATARQSKSKVVADLEGMLPSGNKRNDDALTRAIDNLEDSLSPAYWTDGDHLTEDGRSVFNAERRAVLWLGKVKGSAAASARAAIGTLVEVDRNLARGAIDAAVSGGGDPKGIARAERQMQRAAGELARGKPETAIFHYRNAWDEATKSLRKLIELQVLGINDYHGHLQPNTPGNVAGVAAGGAQYLARKLSQLRAGHVNTLTVAAGDLIGGSPAFSGLFHDEPSVESLNAMQLDVSSVGNHEFDEGVTELLRMQDGGCHPVDGCYFPDDPYAGADFQWLAANVVSESTGETPLPPYWIHEVDEVKVGFIGMTLEATNTLVAADGIVGWEFLDEAETANALVPVLQSEGVEAIIVLLHEGGSQTPPPGAVDACVGISGPIVAINAALDPEIDALITGHTHLPYNCVLPDPAGQPRIVTSAYSYGRVVTELNLVLDTMTNDVRRDVSTARNHTVDQRILAPDPVQTAIIDKWQPLFDASGNTPVGTISADINRGGDPPGSDRGVESAAGNLVADAQLWATSYNGAQIAFMNPGGVRSDLTYAQSGTEGDGVVTFGEAFTFQPFGNTLKTFGMTGAAIVSVLEEQCQPAGSSRPFLHLGVSEGFTYDLSTTIVAGDCTAVEVTNVKLGGVDLDPAAMYVITVNSFLSTGGDNFGTFATVPDSSKLDGGVDLEALTNYLNTFGPVDPPSTDRVNELP
jgi:predicted extracellular nuclease/2',3'-cyclic-nucleotide 2'-phosphodiesterase (5'-nucleotidase family)